MAVTDPIFCEQTFMHNAALPRESVSISTGGNMNVQEEESKEGWGREGYGYERLLRVRRHGTVSANDSLAYGNAFQNSSQSRSLCNSFFWRFRCVFRNTNKCELLRENRKKKKLWIFPQFALSKYLFLVKFFVCNKRTRFFTFLPCALCQTYSKVVNPNKF